MIPSSTLPSRIVATIRSRALFNPGDTLIVGISGGADSTALLDLLANLPDFPLNLVCAHLNHCLRGAESDGDEEFCRQAAARYGVPFESRTVDVKAASRNLEDAGRNARIAFFTELRATWNARAIALAHHADDQAETFLMRLLRGSGPGGLRGMAHRNDRGVVRPLLDVPRSDIEAYLAERGIQWREDSSNSDCSFLRNRIRHELLPLLAQYNPSIHRSFADTAEIIDAEHELLETQANDHFAEICRHTSTGISCFISMLMGLPLAMQRRVIRLALARQCGDLKHFSNGHIAAIITMAGSIRPNARINLPQSLVAVREYDQLIFRTKSAPTAQSPELEICGPGEYQLPTGSHLRIEETDAPAEAAVHDPTITYVDLDKAPFPWHLRTARPGDRIQPSGMTGHKKLKDLFIDGKIPLSLRRVTPLIFSRGELILVCGVRSSQISCPNTTSSRIAKVVFSRPE